MANFVQWNYPTDIRFGSGVIGHLGELCRELSIHRPLFVTDPGLANLGMTKDAIQCCSDAKLEVNLFSNIKSNPNSTNIQDGLESFNLGNHDSIIAFGGGSALDAGKAIALMSGQKHSLWDFEDIGDNWKKADLSGIAPVIAIPTTAGTGSEVGRVSVITDETKKLKRLIFHPKMLPACVLLDPELTLGLPADLTAVTGMDALSHNLEAFCAPTDHPIARGIAVEGCRIIAENLIAAVKDGRNIKARGRMLIASTMGATSFQKGLGSMHALAHSIGGLFDTHHGTLNAILMPYVLIANRKMIENNISYLSGCLGLEKTFDAFIKWIFFLRNELNIPHTLSEVNIPTKAAKTIGKIAEKDSAGATNPIIFDAVDYEEICIKAILGKVN